MNAVGRLLQKPSDEELLDMKSVFQHRTGEDPDDCFRAFDRYRLSTKVTEDDRAIYM